VAVMHHEKSYADKVKEIKESAKLPALCTTCNMALSFTDDDPSPGLKPHIRPLFVTSYMRGQKLKCIFVMAPQSTSCPSLI